MFVRKVHRWDIQRKFGFIFSGGLPVFLPIRAFCEFKNSEAPDLNDALVVIHQIGGKDEQGRQRILTAETLGTYHRRLAREKKEEELKDVLDKLLPELVKEYRTLPLFYSGKMSPEGSFARVLGTPEAHFVSLGQEGLTYELNWSADFHLEGHDECGGEAEVCSVSKEFSRRCGEGIEGVRVDKKEKVIFNQTTEKLSVPFKRRFEIGLPDEVYLRFREYYPVAYGVPLIKNGTIVQDVTVQTPVGEVKKRLAVWHKWGPANDKVGGGFKIEDLIARLEEGEGG